jgi:hypothetical protein
MLLILAMAQSGQVDLGAAVSKEVARQECRQTDPDEILVCGRRKADERYRMPDRNGPFDPDGDQQSVMRERSSWVEYGDTGINSCGPVGPGGWTGCMVKSWEQERQQSAWGKNRSKKW